jgi:nucleotide-binding universal stress UspA family protein
VCHKSCLDSHQVAIGDAENVLVQIAEKRAADLIVLGRSQPWKG